MNLGVFGMSQGVPGQLRKFSGRVDAGSVFTVKSPPIAWGIVGLGYVTLSPSAGTRTRVASVSGRGALRCYASQTNVVAGDTQKLEVWIDGKKVIEMSATPVQSSGINAVGFAYSSDGSTASVAQFDYISFDASCELYLTCTTGGSNSASVAYRIDLHE